MGVCEHKQDLEVWISWNYTTIQRKWCKHPNNVSRVPSCGQNIWGDGTCQVWVCVIDVQNSV